jgi:hypothetical protein
MTTAVLYKLTDVLEVLTASIIKATTLISLIIEPVIVSEMSSQFGIGDACTSETSNNSGLNYQ